MELEYLLRHGGPSARGGHVFVYTKEFFAAEYIQAIHCRVMGWLLEGNSVKFAMQKAGRGVME